MPQGESIRNWIPKQFAGDREGPKDMSGKSHQYVTQSAAGPSTQYPVPQDENLSKVEQKQMAKMFI